ncbi:MAG: NUDIX domain-containing protein [Chloroflexota bacterium]
MPSRVEIISTEDVFQQSIFRVEAARLRYERYDGQLTEELTRLSLERGESVAAIIHDPVADTVVLTEQFRYPTYGGGHGWLLELPAGMIDEDEHPLLAMQRELREEVGYDVEKLYHISTFFLSPGGSSERIHLFYARVSDANHVNGGGGVLDEGEDIRTLVVPVQRILADIARGNLVDAKTIIGLQWLHINRAHLPGAD